MNFSFELDGAIMTGNVHPEAITSLWAIFGTLFGWMIMVWFTIYAAIIVLMIISRWRVFKKAGFPGRGILIPIYNRVLMFKLGGMSGRRAASIIFPPLFLIAMIVNYFKIAEKFGKHRAFGLGILFVKIVFIPILAFDNSKRGKQAKKPVATPIAKAPIKKTPVKKVIKKTPAKKTIKKTPIKKSPAKKPIKKVKTLKSKK